MSKSDSKIYYTIIIVDGYLWSLMMAEDDSRCCFGVSGPLFQPKNLKIKQYACFFKARLMVMLPDVEIPVKSQKWRKTEFKKNRIFENRKFRQDRCPNVFFGGSHTQTIPKIPKETWFSLIFQKLRFLCFILIYIEKAPGPQTLCL